MGFGGFWGVRVYGLGFRVSGLEVPRVGFVHG